MRCLYTRDSTLQWLSHVRLIFYKTYKCVRSVVFNNNDWLRYTMPSERNRRKNRTQLWTGLNLTWSNDRRGVRRVALQLKTLTRTNPLKDVDQHVHTVITYLHVVKVAASVPRTANDVDFLVECTTRRHIEVLHITLLSESPRNEKWNGISTTGKYKSLHVPYSFIRLYFVLLLLLNSKRSDEWIYYEMFWNLYYLYILFFVTEDTES